jgi:hypothetical protein
MIPGCLDGMTRAEAWRNEYLIQRLAAINREHDEGTEREVSTDGDQAEEPNCKSEKRRIGTEPRK